MAKRVQSHVLEFVLGLLMGLFGFAGIYILIKAIKIGNPAPELAILEVLIIIILGMLGQMVILIKIYEQGLTNQLDNK